VPIQGTVTIIKGGFSFSFGGCVMSAFCPIVLQNSAVFCRQAGFER
jgi:hypothetical protein